MGSIQHDNMRKGPWEEDEDKLLKSAVLKNGEGRWDSLAQASDLLRCGKSCRLRWLNYLRPNLKRGKISYDEETLIIEYQQQWGNKWSKIAKMLPGRTDNELKNHWRTRVRKHQTQIRKLENIINLVDHQMYANNMSDSCEQGSSSSEPTARQSCLGINGVNNEEFFMDKIVPTDNICAMLRTTNSNDSDTDYFSFGGVGCSDDHFGIVDDEGMLDYWTSDFSDNNTNNQANGYDL